MEQQDCQRRDVEDSVHGSICQNTRELVEELNEEYSGAEVRTGHELEHSPGTTILCLPTRTGGTKPLESCLHNF